MLRAQIGDQRGFSMIEVMVAILVFGLVTVGITPLLLSSIQASSLARSQTIGKNLVQESMERLRGLPYFDSASGRDVLDLYFPNLSTGYNAGSGTFVTTCTSLASTPSPSADRACPKNTDGTARVPAGYTLTFSARFVKSVIGSDPETFTLELPASTYDASVSSTATPPSLLLEVTISAQWIQRGRNRQFSLVSLVGDRRLSPERVRGIATIDFLAQAFTAFSDNNVPPRVSGLTAFMGRTSSQVEIRNFAAAITDSNAGEMVLASDQTSLGQGTNIDTASGARATFRAPPDTSPVSATVAPAGEVTHTNVLVGENVGEMGASTVNTTTGFTNTPEVKVPNGLPKATTNFLYTGGVGELFWVNNQKDESDGPLTMRLDPFKHVFSVWRETNEKAAGETRAEATEILPASSRKVEAVATAQASKIVLLPVSYASGDKGVLVLDDFTSTVTCRSTGSASTAVATGSWSATLKYWRDNDQGGNNLAIGAYSAGIPITVTEATAATDALATLKSTNPMVYDGNVLQEDIYLFDDPASSKRGYLDLSSSMTTQFTATKTATASRVSIPFAMSLGTARTDSANPETKLNIAVGKLSCQTLDNR